MAFCALKFVFFDFLPVSLHYADLRFVLDGAPSEQLLTKQLQASVMKAARVSETGVFALFYSAQHFILHRATRSPLFRFTEAMLALLGDH